MQGEISYDLEMGDDMGFVEGTYRLGRGDWQVFIFTRLNRKEIEQPRWEVSVWDSGATGFVFFVPRYLVSASNHHLCRPGSGGRTTPFSSGAGCNGFKPWETGMPAPPAATAGSARKP
jgi:hypothetical protein